MGKKKRLSEEQILAEHLNDLVGKREKRNIHKEMFKLKLYAYLQDPTVFAYPLHWLRANQDRLYG